jgi:hypothetical protein
MEDEGTISNACSSCTFIDIICMSSRVACNIVDWVQVECDYSPGICSEGGTAVVDILLISGLVTVKYIYDPSSTGNKSDDVIGSSLQGKLETGITMRGAQIHKFLLLGH